MGEKSKQNKNKKSTSAVCSIVAPLLPPPQLLPSVITYRPSSSAADTKFPPVSYVIATPTAAYALPEPSRSVFSQDSAVVYGGSYTSSYSSHGYQPTNTINRCGCGRYISHEEDIKPNLSTTTSAFSLPSSCYSPVNSAVSVDSGIETGIGSGSFHSSSYSVFSLFGSDHDSPLQPLHLLLTGSPLHHSDIIISHP